MESECLCREKGVGREEVKKTVAKANYGTAEGLGGINVEIVNYIGNEIVYWMLLYAIWY